LSMSEKSASSAPPEMATPGSMFASRSGCGPDPLSTIATITPAPRVVDHTDGAPVAVSPHCWGARGSFVAARAVDGALVARVDGLSPSDFRDLAIAVRGKNAVEAVVLGGVSDSGGVALVAAVVSASGLKAGELIKDAAKTVGGGGGGKGDIATAGGKNAGALDAALAAATAAVAAARRAS